MVSVFLLSTTVALSDTSLKFGVQLIGTVSSPQEVTLTNTGPIALSISSISASGDFLQRNNCGSSLAAGESCTIRITFNPTDKGTRTGDVTINDDAADNPQVIALTGTGTVVQLTPSSLDFGNQRVGTISRPKTVILTNTGSTPLSVHGINITGTDFSDFAETSTCRSSVPAHTSCEIHVRFGPSDTGTRKASLKVLHDGGGEQPVRLRGTGISN
jgi:Abnormal spindle-like microcephaly-assoc'd, ASPM-SPD-2-Hydin